MTFEEATADSTAPHEVLATQTLIDVPFWNFNRKKKRGQLVVARDLAMEIETIFWEIYEDRFSIFSVIPVVAFDWSDDASMEANNCSAFNYRHKALKTALSAHATGRAVDINPLQNPYINGETVLPPGAVYNFDAPGAISADGIVVRAFEKRGWTWGGRWTSLLDYHHFEKPPI